MARRGGGRLDAPPPPQFFFAKMAAQRRHFWNTCSDIFSAHCVKILAPGHVRSGHKASSRDPTSEKVWSRAKVTVFVQSTSNFLTCVRGWIPTKRISRFFRIGDLRSGQFCDLPILSQMGEKSYTTKTHLTGSNRSWSCQIRLLLMTQMQKKNPLKGHLKSNDYVIWSIYVFANNSW